jgi:trehalose 6-phosphate synthase
VDLVIVSNRGPRSFRRAADGRLTAHPGAGGLASALAPVAAATNATWVAAAITDADREAAAAGPIDAAGVRFRFLTPDRSRYRLAYDEIANATLWFLNHRLFDLARQPRLDPRWWDAWEAYREINRCFALAVIDVAPAGATVLVQDYHLALVGRWLRHERPDLRTVHFTHTPFCDPVDIGVLPGQVASELLTGMTSHRACGFHTTRWAEAFAGCCRAVLGVEAPTFVAPLGPDIEGLHAVAQSAEGTAAAARLDQVVGDRRMILRVDRIEPSKNLLRGFLAFDQLLEAQPDWRGRVVFVAVVYPSREHLPDYAAYRREVEELVARVNDRWARPGWTPIVLDTEDDLPRSVAALGRYDVLLVNPIRDGLNLVAKEGPLLNARHGVLLLSREAGAWAELGHTAIGLDPFDVRATAGALQTALAMGEADRRDHAAAVRAAAGARRPRDWLADQLAAAGAG